MTTAVDTATHSLREIVDVGRVDPLYVWGCSCEAFGVSRCHTEEKAVLDWFLHWRDAQGRQSGLRCVRGHDRCSVIDGGSCRRLPCTCETAGHCEACGGGFRENEQGVAVWKRFGFSAGGE